MSYSRHKLAVDSPAWFNIVKRLKELEVKNSRLKKVYADERLMSQIRLEALEGKL
jgi:putative transposase